MTTNWLYFSSLPFPSISAITHSSLLFSSSYSYNLHPPSSFHTLTPSRNIPHYTTQHHTVPHHTTLHYTTQRNTTHHTTTQHTTLQHTTSLTQIQDLLIYRNFFRFLRNDSVYLNILFHYPKHRINGLNISFSSYYFLSFDALCFF